MLKYLALTLFAALFGAQANAATYYFATDAAHCTDNFAPYNAFICQARLFFDVAPEEYGKISDISGGFWIYKNGLIEAAPFGNYYPDDDLLYCEDACAKALTDDDGNLINFFAGMFNAPFELQANMDGFGYDPRSIDSSIVYAGGRWAIAGSTRPTLLPPVPLPATLPLALTAFAMAGLIFRRRKTG